jgi:cell division protein FtsL
LIEAERQSATWQIEPHQQPGVVSRPKNRTKSNSLKYVQAAALIVICFCVGLAYTYRHEQVISLGYRINATKQNIAALQRDNKQLELQVAELQAPNRVESVAINKIGMKQPDNYLLAVIPSNPNVAKQKPPANAQKIGKSWTTMISMAAQHLIGRAEASPR